MSGHDVSLEHRYAEVEEKMRSKVATQKLDPNFSYEAEKGYLLFSFVRIANSHELSP
jgi:hypothetical protein